MSKQKYIGLNSLSDFLEKIKIIFAPIDHSHAVDAELSSDSTNPVQNKVIKKEFENVKASFDDVTNIFKTIVDAITSLNENKADVEHDHNTVYYTKTEIDQHLSGKTQVQIITWGADD